MTGRAAVTVADLLHAVENLDDAALDRLLDALAGSRRVEDAGWRVRERRESPERYPERNAKVRLLAKRLSYGQIARKLGMSRSAVAKVVQRGRRIGVSIESVSTPSAAYHAKWRARA